jgi:hypothetical protein
MDHIENVQEYHDVVARSTIGIITALTSNNSATNKTAKILMMFNIRQAYILYRHESDEVMEHIADAKQKGKTIPKIEQDLIDELNDMKLDDKTDEELQVLMFSFQARAGIKPVQSFKMKARTYERMRDEL